MPPSGEAALRSEAGRQNAHTQEDASDSLSW